MRMFLKVGRVILNPPLRLTVGVNGALRITRPTWCLLLVQFALALPAFAASTKPKPNVILILADDMGIGDLSCYGGKQVPTPRIDKLAAQGTRFMHYYSASPICSPSRCGIITGMYPARWNITSFEQTREGNAGCEMADFLDPKAPALPRALKTAG